MIIINANEHVQHFSFVLPNQVEQLQVGFMLDDMALVHSERDVSLEWDRHRTIRTCQNLLLCPNSPHPK